MAARIFLDSSFRDVLDFWKVVKSVSRVRSFDLELNLVLGAIVSIDGTKLDSCPGYGVAEACALRLRRPMRLQFTRRSI